MSETQGQGIQNSLMPTSKRIKFVGVVPANGVAKKKGFNGDVQGRLVLTGAQSNISAKVEITYLNEDFLRRAAPHEQYDVEVIIRKRGE